MVCDRAADSDEDPLSPRSQLLAESGGTMRGTEAKDVASAVDPRSGMVCDEDEAKKVAAGWSTEVIKDFLYLGTEANASDEKQLTHVTASITHVLRVMNPAKGKQFECVQEYSSIPLDDKATEPISNLIPKAVKYIEGVRAKSGAKLLVYCDKEPLSRSTTMVVAYLMKSENLGVDAALKKVNAARTAQFQKAVKPNHGFIRQLKAYARDLKKPANRRTR